jgi:hypothetical protein
LARYLSKAYNFGEIEMMEKKTVNVGEYPITQLTDTEFEAANPEQNLDFYFETDDPEEVKVFVFDSLIPTKSKDDPCLAVFYAASLEEAVTDAMTFRKDDLKNYGFTA